MQAIPLLPRVALLVVLVAAPALQAQTGPEGRWEGVIEVPAAAQALVIDLAPAPAGTWTGSMILPGRGVKGAPLGDLHVEAGTVRFSIAAGLPGPVDPPPLLGATLGADGALRGELQLAGLSAPVVLRRSGPAQPDRPPASTPLAAALEGAWTGGYELLGYPRTVSLQLAGSTARMRIVGRRTTDIDFALVRQKGVFLSLSGNPYDIVFEGNWNEAGARIDGTFMQGPIELPLQLRRDGKEN